MSINVYSIKVTRLSYKNYCYLIIHPKTHEAILIDPAWEMDKIEQGLRIHNANLISILLTHHHFDHVNLAEEISTKYNVPIRMSNQEIEAYSFFLPKLVPIDHSNTLVFGKITVQPLLTPGHTKGALCYLIEDALFTGDTLFIEGCGICFGKGGDPSEMFDSLNYLKRIVPSHTKVYPGHSYGKEPGESFRYLLKNNIYLHFSTREQFICSGLLSK